MEIEDERRWLLLDGMPDLNSRKFTSVDQYDHITQFYLPTKEGTLRFRKAVGTRGNHYSQTIKGPKDYSAGPEWNVLEVEEWVFGLMQKSAIGTVEKGRTAILAQAMKFELDEFMGSCAGLVIVELEFMAPKNADPNLVELLHQQYRELELPEAFGRNIEITGDNAYGNYWLALNGIPQVVHDH